MSDRASTRVRGLALLGLGLSACVLHQPGLLVEVRLDVRMPSTLAASTLTRVELVPCPGTTDPLAHHHDESAPLGISLGTPESVWLTPREGRYCDLRVQLEGTNIATRQAVLPMLCDGARVDLLLDTSDVAAPPRTMSLHVGGPTDSDEIHPQRALERLLRTLEVDACP